MKIKYLITRASSMSTKLTYRESSYITSIVYRINHQQLQLTAKDILAIFFEQTLMTDYLLAANPRNKPLLDYRATLQFNLPKYFNRSELSEEVLEQQQINVIDCGLVKDFVTDKQKIPASAISSIVKTFSGSAQSKYATMPHNFSIPYLSYLTNSIHTLNSGEDYINPLVLSPVCRKNKDGDLAITFYVRPYTSMKSTKDTPTQFDSTLGYICSMNHVGKDWKELIDTVQSLYIPTNTSISAFESLSGVLNNYLHGNSLPMMIDGKEYSQKLLQVLKYVLTKNTSMFDKTKNEVFLLVDIFQYLKDNRLKYLTETDPLVVAKERWDSQFELQFLNDYSLIGYGMEADKSDSSEEDDSANTEDDTSTDSNTDSKDSENQDDAEESEDDPFGGGDDFADGEEESDEGDGDGSDTSTDTSSSDSSDSSKSDSSGVDPDDVNPLIELIDDETFDEYLDRGTLQHQIKALINRPPATVSAEDIEFLKYWFIQWFPCVSVATTREIIGDLLDIKTTKQ